MTPIDTGILDIEQDTADARLRDQEWIDTEFLAIMTASGMTADVVVAVQDRESGRAPDLFDHRPPQARRGAGSPRGSSDHERVRSPPRR